MENIIDTFGVPLVWFLAFIIIYFAKAFKIFYLVTIFFHIAIEFELTSQIKRIHRAVLIGFLTASIIAIILKSVLIE